ncbi:MAG: ZIP family metal transporter [Acidimicrobiia bacterium]|nr:ZIP family metal transporter [Acidimicrobiia bacterium]
MSIVLLAIAILVLTLVGCLAPRALASRLSERQLADMTGIAAGLLLASALLVVIPEGFHTASGVHTDHEVSADEDHADEEHVDEEHEDEEHADEDHGEQEHGEEEHEGETDAFVYDPAILGLTILAGFSAMLLLEGFGVGHAVHEEHHSHAEGHGHGHVHHPSSMSVLAVGLSAHAAADGFAIGAAAATGETAFSVLVALAVILHRIPAAFSLGMFALHETTNTRAVVRGLFAFSVATPLTMLVSYLLLDGASTGLVAIALLFSAGTFLYVATVDTLPAIHNPENGRRSVRNVLLGALLLSVVLFSADAAGLLEHAH